MSNYYLRKWLGTYRLKTQVDQNTNDFQRDMNGNIEGTDVYIDCRNGDRIYHYGGSILEAYITSLQRGHNILKKICANHDIDISNYIDTYRCWDKVERLMCKSNILKAAYESDEELSFRFHKDLLPEVAEFMKVKTNGANRSPFSRKNLPKSKYEIPDNDIEKYKQIISLFVPNPETKSETMQGTLVIYSLTKKFITNIPRKHKEYKGQDMEKLRLKMTMNNKQFIHSIGLWEEYLHYLEKEQRSI